MNQLLSTLSNISSDNLVQTVITLTILPLLIQHANQLLQNLPTHITTIARKIFDKSFNNCVETTCKDYTMYQEMRNDMYAIVQSYVNTLLKHHSEIVAWNNDPVVEAMYPQYIPSFSLNINKSITFWVNSNDWSLAPKQTESIPSSLFGLLERHLSALTSKVESYTSLNFFRNYQKQSKSDINNTILKVEISCNAESKGSNQELPFQNKSKSNYKIKLYNTTDHKTLHNFIQHLIKKDTDEKIKQSHIVTVDSGNDINDLYTSTRYDLDCLLLDDGFRNKMRKDFKNFWSDESYYSNICQPFRRGYLLMGPPGCGKSSIIKCLQNECPRTVDLMIVKMSSSIKENESILQKLKKMTRGPAIWVFEDIDCVGDYLNKRSESSSFSRDENQKREGLSDFLNTIDGIGTPEGIMIIFTSNYPKNLDEALTRPGRMDRIWNVGPVTDRKLIQRYFDKFIPNTQLPDEFFELVLHQDVTPSFIVKIFGIFRNMYQENDKNADLIDFVKITNDFLKERNLLS